MQVKVGSELSRQFCVTGGAVQSSVLGVMDHNAVMETVDEEIDLPTEKYVDDMTMIESLSKTVDNMCAVECEASMARLDITCNEMCLKIKKKKTQLLALN